MPFFIAYIYRLDSSRSKSSLPFWALLYQILNYHVSKYGILTWPMAKYLSTRNLLKGANSSTSDRFVDQNFHLWIFISLQLLIANFFYGPWQTYWISIFSFCFPIQLLTYHVAFLDFLPTPIQPSELNNLINHKDISYISWHVSVHVQCFIDPQ